MSESQAFHKALAKALDLHQPDALARWRPGPWPPGKEHDMDPNTTLTRLLDAFANQDREAAVEAGDELIDWVAAWGFLPDDPREAHAGVIRVMMDVIEAADILIGHARHEDDCEFRRALYRGEGRIHGGPGGECNCGFTERSNEYEDALARFRALSS